MNGLYDVPELLCADFGILIAAKTVTPTQSRIGSLTVRRTAP